MVHTYFRNHPTTVYAGPVSAWRRRIRRAANLLSDFRTKGGTAVKPVLVVQTAAAVAEVVAVVAATAEVMVVVVAAFAVVKAVAATMAATVNRPGRRYHYPYTNYECGRYIGCFALGMYVR